jgi:hypothetical protein
MKRAGLYLCGFLVALSLPFAVRTLVGAQGASNNFRIDESFIGPGGNLDSSSTSFQLQSGQQSLGNIGVGSGASSSFQVQNGLITTPDPTLSCVINTASVPLGSFSTAVTASGTATFSVLNYTSYGYVVSVIGNPPSTSGHTLTNLGSNAGSSVNTEQFGINLTTNNVPTASPSVFGLDPVQQPDNSFSFGNIAANYDTSNSFRYNNGETIASATKSSGQTDYTISYIVNVSNSTPGGTYTGDQAIVCTGTY